MKGDAQNLVSVHTAMQVAAASASSKQQAASSTQELTTHRIFVYVCNTQAFWVDRGRQAWNRVYGAEAQVRELQQEDAKVGCCCAI